MKKSWVHESQIHWENIQTIFEVLEQMEKRETDALLFFTDFEKAFGSFNHFSSFGIFLILAKQ
jgi:hypothetical protein